MPSIYVKETDTLPGRDKYEHYPTDPKAVVMMCRILNSCLPPVVNGYDFVDVGAGNGIWGQKLQRVRSGDWTDSYSGIEIRDLPAPKGYDFWYPLTDATTLSVPLRKHSVSVAFGNPPYLKPWNKMLKLIAKYVDAFDITAFLLKQSFLAGQARAQFFQHNPPLYIFQSASRISFSKDGKTNADEYIFLIWKKPYGHKGPVDTRFYWFNFQKNWIDPRFKA